MTGTDSHIPETPDVVEVSSARKPSTKRSSFPIWEERIRTFAPYVFLVIPLVAVLVLMFMPVRGNDRPVKLAAAKAVLKMMANALESYKTDHGDYPTSLRGLIQPAFGPAYLDPNAILNDPWDNPVCYAPGSMSVQHPKTFDLWSAGPDGVSGNADDITNW